MKLLMTDAGVTNDSIHAALTGMLGRPIDECTALCVPTAGYGHPMAGPGKAYEFVAGLGGENKMTELGWKSIGLLELTALPSLGDDRWQTWVREADALLVNGGDALYLAYWMRESGLADLLPSLADTVYVGLSAGSMVLTPSIGREFSEWKALPEGDEGETLGLVDFRMFPHLGMNPMAAAERWAARLGGPAYVTDNQTAISVVDGVVEVVSEGEWHKFD